MREGRTCYDHLAGKVGTKLAEVLHDKGYINGSADNYNLTDNGLEFFNDFGIDIAKVKRRRRNHTLEDP
ncbi:hypothetical protein GCM10025859_46880 [Alicyclobacillus fastidiosus]|nr:hypothetical protein GCM10025859_46880 [Alicyclobacillus fastidiosus]